ncbi:MAG: hypothetical protein AB1921_16085 [Thermodesulfobacteriota bacterium]
MRLILCIFSLAVSYLAFSASAFAYIGPGAGLSAIGTVVAVIGAILFAIVGFVWYPIKKLIKRIRGNKKQKQDDSAA